MTLSEIDLRRLEVAAQRWSSLGRKEAHVHEVFGESLAVFSLRLNRLLDDPRALAASPVTVRRLRRLRDMRRRARGSLAEGA